MNISDVMIHINESLNVEARTSLEEAMRQIEGVVAPRFSPGKEHLLVVAYNPEETSTAALFGEGSGSRLYRPADWRVSEVDLAGTEHPSRMLGFAALTPAYALKPQCRVGEGFLRNLTKRCIATQHLF